HSVRHPDDGLAAGSVRFAVSMVCGCWRRLITLFHPPHRMPQESTHDRNLDAGLACRHRSADRRGPRPRAGPSAFDARDDRLGELRPACRAGSTGLGADEQVCRRLPRQALLRRVQYVDVAENLAIERAKSLLGAEYANVQPHSGASANAAVMHALARHGDKLLGLSLAHGGHLTHGMKINFSGRLYDVASYEVDPDTYRIDMDKVREKALEHRPQVIVAGWSAYPRQLDFQAFREIADEVGAKLWVDMAHFAGLVAADLHPNPVPFADVVSSTVHKTIGGPR